MKAPSAQTEQHTKGPWRMDSDGWCIEAETYENQRLIAAAPELLALLQEWAHDYEFTASAHSNTFAGRVREVLAKVRVA